MRILFCFSTLLFVSQVVLAQPTITTGGDSPSSIIHPGGNISVVIDKAAFSAGWNNYYSQRRNPLKEEFVFGGIFGDAKAKEGDTQVSLFSGSIRPSATMGLLGGYQKMYMTTGGSSSMEENQLHQSYISFQEDLDVFGKVLAPILISLGIKKDPQSFAELSSETRAGLKVLLDTTLNKYYTRRYDTIQMPDGDKKSKIDSLVKAHVEKLLPLYYKNRIENGIIIYEQKEGEDGKMIDVRTDAHQKALDSRMSYFKHHAIERFDGWGSVKVRILTLYLSPTLTGSEAIYIQNVAFPFDSLKKEVVWEPGIGVGASYYFADKRLVIGARADFIRGTNITDLDKIKLREEYVSFNTDSTAKTTILKEEEVRLGDLNRLTKIPIRADIIYYFDLIEDGPEENSTVLGWNIYSRYTIRESPNNKLDFGTALLIYTKKGFGGGVFMETSDINKQSDYFLSKNYFKESFQVGIVASLSLHSIENIFGKLNKPTTL